MISFEMVSILLFLTELTIGGFTLHYYIGGNYSCLPKQKINHQKTCDDLELELKE